MPLRIAYNVPLEMYRNASLEFGKCYYFVSIMELDLVIVFWIFRLISMP